MKPMKLTDVGTDVEPYLVDPEWVMQQKHDGARMLAVYQLGELTFLNGSGGLMSFSAAKLKLPELEKHMIRDLQALEVANATFDGELLIEEGVYHIFDVISLRWDTARFTTDAARESEGWAILGHEHWKWRDAVLRSTLASLEGSLVRFAVTARTEAEKRELWAAINEAAVEGAVSKHVGSFWVEGTRTTQWVKHKLVKAADVVVTAVQRTFKADGVTLSHGKAELAVPIEFDDDPLPYVNAKGKRASRYQLPATIDAINKSGWRLEPRNLLPVGNASLIGKELTIDVGSVVEVNYLYWTGDAMVQPRIVRERFDKGASECNLAQFPEYTRTVVTL